MLDRGERFRPGQSSFRIPLVAAMRWSDGSLQSSGSPDAAGLGRSISSQVDRTKLFPSSCPRPAHVVVADRHPLMLEGLAHVLRTCAVDSIERCHDGERLRDSLLRSQTDLAIIDIRLGDPHALALLADVRRLGSQALCVLTTDALADVELLEGVRLGVRGLISRDAPLETVAHCFRTVLAGDTCLDQRLLGQAMSSLLAREAALRELAGLLTAREIEVFQLVATGLSTRDIANRVHVSTGTLKIHVHHIYQKLRISSRAELIEFARQRSLA